MCHRCSKGCDYGYIGLVENVPKSYGYYYHTESYSDKKQVEDFFKRVKSAGESDKLTVKQLKTALQEALKLCEKLEKKDSCHTAKTDVTNSSEKP